jgi:hypothetical protein
VVAGTSSQQASSVRSRIGRAQQGASLKTNFA